MFAHASGSLLTRLTDKIDHGTVHLRAVGIYIRPAVQFEYDNNRKTSVSAIPVFVRARVRARGRSRATATRNAK